MENEVLKCSNLDTLENNEYDLGDLVINLNNCVENERHYLTAFFMQYAFEKIGHDTLLNVLDCANLTAKQKSNSKKYLREYFYKKH